MSLLAKRVQLYLCVNICLGTLITPTIIRSNYQAEQLVVVVVVVVVVVEEEEEPEQRPEEPEQRPEEPEQRPGLGDVVVAVAVVVVVVVGGGGFECWQSQPRSPSQFSIWLSL